MLLNLAFRSKHSTQLASTLLLDKIRSNTDKGLLTGVIFMDLKKAFDTVSHSNLLNKLPTFGLTSTELEWFTNYLFSRSQIINFDGALSDESCVTSGVPQGSILGPLLFILYLNDIDDHLTHAEILKYADDTVLFLSGQTTSEIEVQLTEEMIGVGDWLKENDLIINLNKGKTETMVFGSSRNVRNKSLEVYFNAKVINYTTGYKYLGVLLDQAVNLNEHFDTVFKKALGRLRLLKR